MSTPETPAHGIGNYVSGGSQDISGIQSTGANASITQTVTRDSSTAPTTPADLLAALATVRSELDAALAQQPDLLTARDLTEVQGAMTLVEQEIQDPAAATPNSGRIRRGVDVGRVKERRVQRAAPPDWCR
jgi:hypothetical protein